MALQNTPVLNWHLLYTRPRFEAKLKKEITDLQYECYLPMRTVTRKWSDRIKKLNEPLFPGYVFVKIPKKDRYRILLLSGSVEFVSFEGEPAILQEKLIEDVRRLEMHDTESIPYYSAGEKVIITQGAFAGFEGELIRIQSKLKVVIKISPIKQALAVEVDSSCISRLVY